ncbi:hypothetical protein KIN20_015016 [Parelaphostrongylus tenuis]|uniref:Uncharacterized protein n=1 Tax=Parelaphostrongylus tenuis TaxID=148309 RepID=A0AAD5ME78_PARTN|nr:hypothetical protein KIN20_015016 [Parelaphostrongylus tenuis]
MHRGFIRTFTGYMESHRNAPKRLPRGKREAVLRLCCYDTEFEQKVVMVQYGIVRLRNDL